MKRTASPLTPALFPLRGEGEEPSRLTVLNVAYPLAPVGPDAVGGAEQVLTQIDAALVDRGHQSIVIACQGSTTRGILVPTPKPTGTLDEEARCEAWKNHRNAIAFALQRWPIDLVHLHGVDFHQYLPAPGPPTLATLHLPPDWYARRVFDLARPQTWLNCVSASQRKACPPCDYLLPEIANGIAPHFGRHHHAKRRFALALGRICPEKGFHIALDAAIRADAPLLLAGEVFPYAAHQLYFQEQILPRLSAARRFIGPVGLKRKRRLLAGARCLLVASRVPETSSLVAMEALACGTPVVAFPAGALAEIVEHGETGFLVENERAMAEAIACCDSLDPQTCRQSAYERFNLERTIDQYLRLYRSLARNRFSNEISKDVPHHEHAVADFWQDTNRRIDNAAAVAIAGAGVD